MKWYGLYIDGELQYVIKRFSTPKVRDFGVAETYLNTYKIQEILNTDITLVIPIKSA